METKEFLTKYWNAVSSEDRDTLRTLFHPDAKIILHDTNHILDVESNINFHAGSPERWVMTVDRINQLDTGDYVTVTFAQSASWNGFITSFFTIKEGKITELNEYYAQSDELPAWRDDLVDWGN